jgi:uncharacterized membrane protein
MRGRKFLQTLVVALVAVVGLSACRVDTSVSTVVNPDGSGTVTVTVLADSEVVAAEPKLATELQTSDLTKTGWTITGPTATADGGLSVSFAHPFRNLAEGNEVLASLSGPDGPIIEPLLSSRGSKGEVHWTFVGSIDFSKGLNAIADQDLVSAVGTTPWIAEIERRQLTPGEVTSLTFKLSLPGTAATPTSGTATGRTTGATASSPANEWTVRPGDAALDLDVETVQVSKSVIRARHIESQFTAVLIVYAVLLLGLFALWVYARSRRNRPQPAHEPMKMVEVLDLDPDHRRVMRYLLRSNGSPTAAELAQAVGIPVRELKETVRDLVRAGLVRVENGRVRAVLGKRSSRMSDNERWSKLDDL